METNLYLDELVFGEWSRDLEAVTNRSHFFELYQRPQTYQLPYFAGISEMEDLFFRYKDDVLLTYATNGRGGAKVGKGCENNNQNDDNHVTEHYPALYCAPRKRKTN